jgi:hypothetical protein
MQVSPFAQYFVRKLLRQYFGQVQSLGQYVRMADPSSADLWRIVSGVYSGKNENVEARVYELESLILMYSELESARSTTPDDLAQLENQILQMLGLRLARLLPKTMPSMLPEGMIQRFSFCFGRQVKDGMYCNEQFYGLVQRWSLDASLQAYRLSWALAQKDVPCVLTRSASDNDVWVNLRSPSARVLLHEGPALVEQLLTLYPIVCRFRDRPHRQRCTMPQAA